MQGEARYKYLLGRYLNDMQTDAELEQLYVLTISGRYDYLLHEEAGNSWKQRTESASKEANQDKRKQIIYNYIIRFIRQNQAVSFHRQQNGPRRNFRRWTLAVAAVMTGILALAGWWQFGQNLNKSGSMQPAFALYENKLPQQKHILLSDGSEVILAAHSSMQYYAGDTSGKRLAILHGSAFFNVKPTTDRKPFVVQKNALQTEVLGTSFWVGSVNKNIQVRVLSGKVRVSGLDKKGEKNNLHAPEEVLVLPNQQVNYDEASGSIELGLAGEIHPVSNGHSAQSGHSLDFTYGISLRKLLSVINAVFEVRVMCTNTALLDCELHGNFTGQELHKILDIICLTLNANYQTEKTVLVINGGTCK